MNESTIPTATDASMTTTPTTTLEVWFHRHNGVDLVGGASSVEFALPVSNGIAFSIRLKDIREAARSQNSRSIGKYDSAEIILLHYNNRDVAQSNLSEHCLNPGQVYDVNVHGGTYNEPIIFRILPEEVMSYPPPSAVTTAVAPAATIAAATEAEMLVQSAESFPLSLPATFMAEMDDASVASRSTTSSNGSTSGIPTEKTVGRCGSGHSNDPGNVDYAHAIQCNRPAYLHARSVGDVEKSNCIVDSVVQRFEFYLDGHLYNEAAARVKVRNQLSDKRAADAQQALAKAKGHGSTTTGNTVVAPKKSRGKGSSAIGGHKKTICMFETGAAAKPTVAAPSKSRLPKAASRKKSSKIVVMCGFGAGFGHTPGNLTYKRTIRDYRPAYIAALDKANAVQCKSMLDELVERFEFCRNGTVLNDEAARNKLRAVLKDRRKLRLR